MSEKTKESKDEVIKKEIDKIKEKHSQDKGKKYPLGKLLIKLIEETRDIEAFKILEEEFVDRIIEEEKRTIPPYPESVNKIWFYIKPHDKFVDNWYEMWADVLLIHCKRERKFLVDLNELVNLYPFTGKMGKKLRVSDLEDIVDRLVEKRLAKWLNDDKKLAIIFWVNEQNILQKILKHSRAIGFKYITLDLLDKIWPDLPIEEKVNILNKLVTNKKAKWIIENYAVKILNGA